MEKSRNTEARHSEIGIQGVSNSVLVRPVELTRASLRRAVKGISRA